MRRFLVALSAVALAGCAACSSSDPTPSDPNSADSSPSAAATSSEGAGQRPYSDNPTLEECHGLAHGDDSAEGSARPGVGVEGDTAQAAPTTGDSVDATTLREDGAHPEAATGGQESAGAAEPATGSAAPRDASDAASGAGGSSIAEECLRAIPAQELAGALLATGVTTYEQAEEAVDLGVRHLFIGTGTDFSILNGQGDPARSLAALQERAGGTLEISVDEEGGVVQRLSDLIGPLPSAEEMANTMTPQQVKDTMREHGRKLRDLGLTIDFAPVADLAGAETVEENAIGSRAFSDDPQKVAEYARAYAEGLLEAGIEPVFKHFPGHGHTTGDSHLGTVTAPERAELEANDMVPFAQVAGMPGASMMVGHMQTPGLDGVMPESGDRATGEGGTGGTPVLGANTPASLNPGVYDLLRRGGYSVGAGGVGREGGGAAGAPAFAGTIFTDDLTGMKAVTDLHPGPDAAVAALEAGADQALTAAGAIAVPDLVAAVRQAIESGRISEEHVYAAVARAHL